MIPKKVRQAGAVPTYTVSCNSCTFQRTGVIKTTVANLTKCPDCGAKTTARKEKN